MQLEVARHDTSVASPYELKPSRFSSHTLALKNVPEQGEGRSVLDIGCADGYISRPLAARGYRVTGIDRIGSAFNAPEGIEFIQADLDKSLPALGRSFDFILCLDILEHLRDPLKLLREIAPLMKPGARLIASLPNSGNLYFRMNVLLGRFPKHDRGLFDRTHLHFYTWHGWLDLFSQAGFRITSVRSSTIPVVLVLGDRAPARAMEALGYGLAGLWKKLFAYQFVIAAELD